MKTAPAPGKRKSIYLVGMLVALLGGYAGLTTANAAEQSPLASAVSKGKSLFMHDTFGGNGMTCEACHRAAGLGPTVLPNGAKFPSLSNAAAIFPRYNPRAHKVITIEDQIRGCVARGLGGKPPAYSSASMHELVAYLTSLSQGKPIDMGGKPK